MFVARSKVTGVTFGPFDDEADFETWHAKYAALLDHDDLAREYSTWDVREVTFAEDPHDAAPYTTRFTFGPGRLEDISLEMWRDLTVRVSGQYRIYCGNGQEHPFSVDSGFISQVDWAQYIRHEVETHPRASGIDVRYEAVGHVIEEILGEEWSDPCEIEYGTEEESIAAAEAELALDDDRTETEQDGLAQTMLENPDGLDPADLLEADGHA